MEASKLVHKILKLINYANLCKFTEPRKGPGGAISYNFFFFNYYYDFSHSNFFFFMSLLGHQIFIF